MSTFDKLTIEESSKETFSDVIREISEIKIFIQKELELLEDIQKIVTVSNKKVYRNDWEPNQNIRKQMYEIAKAQTAEYVLKNMSKVKAFNVSLDILTYAISEAVIKGQYLEFGVYSGGTINHIAKLLPDETVYGFDCFEGLPETWRSGYEQGCFKIEKLPDVKSNVNLVKGLFVETLPIFVQAHSEVCALIHIDCDLYSSTVCVLEGLREQIVEGTILVFDEYFNYPGWQDGEFRAFQEFVAKYHLKYEYIGYVEISEQVAVKIIK